MEHPLSIYLKWFDTIPGDNRAKAYLAIKIHDGFAAWEPMRRGGISERQQDVATYVSEQFWTWSHDNTHSFSTEGAVVYLIGATDLFVAEHEAFDEEAWMERMQRTLRSGVDSLVKLAKEAILGRDQWNKEWTDVVNSWKVIRGGPLSMESLLANQRYEEELAMGERGKDPEVQAARQKLQRRLDGEPEDN